MSSIHLPHESAPYLCGREGVWVMGAEKEEGIGGRYGGSGKKILGVFFFSKRSVAVTTPITLNASLYRFISSTMTSACSSHPQLPLKPLENLKLQINKGIFLT